MNPLHDLGYEPDDLTVKVSELLVATSDESDSAIDNSVPEVLRLLRDKMNMDVVFVSEFHDGVREFRHVATSSLAGNVIEEGGSGPLEESWCQRVVDGRLPQYIHDASKEPRSAPLAAQSAIPIGTHISTPIVLKGGEVYGTLCAFSFTPHEHANPADLKKLQFTAQLTAQKIDKQRAEDRARPPEPELSLEPIKTQRRF